MNSWDLLYIAVMFAFAIALAVCSVLQWQCDKKDNKGTLMMIAGVAIAIILIAWFPSQVAKARSEKDEIFRQLQERELNKQNMYIEDRKENEDVGDIGY